MRSIVWRVSPTTPPFTDKQGQYLAFIRAYSRIFRQPPAEADMQRHFQVSPPSVHQMVLTLERAGLIRRTPGVARSTGFWSSPRTSQVEILRSAFRPSQTFPIVFSRRCYRRREWSCSSTPSSRRWKSGRLQIGLWHSLSSHLVAEILADCGFDWILLDTEHAPNEVPMLLTQLQAMSAGTARTGGRPAWNDPVMIKRLLDVSAQSLLVPYIETEEEAKRAVQSTRYPPEGFRRLRLAGGARASRYGRIKGYHADAEICLLLQVETRRGPQNLERIARVDGVDGIFIGQAIFRPPLGHLGEPNHPEIVKTIDEAIRRIKRRRQRTRHSYRQRSTGSKAPDIEQGCLFTAVGSDIGLIANGAEQLAAKFRSQNPGR